MRRLLTIAATAVILLLTLAPAAFAADPVPFTDRGAIVTVNGTVDVPAGQSVDVVVVVDGTATIAGTVRSVVVVHGTVTLVGATARNLVVVDGTANLGAGTTVTGNVSTLNGTVSRDPAAIVVGRTTTFDADLAGLAILMIPLLIALSVGFGLAMVVTALLVAALAARQVRRAEAVISQRPGQALVAGIAGTVGLPVLAVALIVTVVGAPIGFAMLLLALPILALAGWLVAAMWVGDWLVARTSGTPEAGRPYRAAVLGVIVLALAGLIPFVGTLATLFGVGALLVGAWHTLRPEPVTTSAPAPAAWTQSTPSAA